MVRGTPGVFPSRGPTFRSSALVDFAASSESLPGFAGLRVSARLPSRGGRHVWDRSSGFAPPPALQRARCSAVLPPPGTVPSVPQPPCLRFLSAWRAPRLAGLRAGLRACCIPLLAMGFAAFPTSCPRRSFATSRWRRPAGCWSSSSRRWTLRSLSLTRSRGRVTDASLPNRRSPSSALPSCRYRAHPASRAPVPPPVTRFPYGSAPRLRGPPTPPHATVSSPGSVKVRRPRVSPTRASDRLPGRSPRCPPSTASP